MFELVWRWNDSQYFMCWDHFAASLGVYGRCMVLAFARGLIAGGFTVFPC